MVDCIALQTRTISQVWACETMSDCLPLWTRPAWQVWACVKDMHRRNRLRSTVNTNVFIGLGMEKFPRGSRLRSSVNTNVITSEVAVFISIVWMIAFEGPLPHTHVLQRSNPTHWGQRQRSRWLECSLRIDTYSIPNHANASQNAPFLSRTMNGDQHDGSIRSCRQTPTHTHAGSAKKTVNGQPCMPHCATCFKQGGKKDKRNLHSVYTSQITLKKLNGRNCVSLQFQRFPPQQHFPRRQGLQTIKMPSYCLNNILTFRPWFGHQMLRLVPVPSLTCIQATCGFAPCRKLTWSIHSASAIVRVGGPPFVFLTFQCHTTAANFSTGRPKDTSMVVFGIPKPFFFICELGFDPVCRAAAGLGHWNLPWGKWPSRPSTSYVPKRNAFQLATSWSRATWSANFHCGYFFCWPCLHGQWPTVNGQWLTISNSWWNRLSICKIFAVPGRKTKRRLLRNEKKTGKKKKKCRCIQSGHPKTVGRDAIEL